MMEDRPLRGKEFDRQRQLYAEQRLEDGLSEGPILPAFAKKLVSSHWARQWCLALNSYALYGHALAAGRTLLRKGCVFDLAIHEPTSQGEHMVTATVWAGEAYQVSARFAPLSDEARANVQRHIAGSLSVTALLAGDIPDALSEVLADPHEGIVPDFGELRFSCTCPEYAELCPHGAALLYALAVRLDDEPHLLMHLRGTTAAALIDGSVAEDGAASGSEGEEDDDSIAIAAMFDLDWDEGGEADSQVEPCPPQSPASASQHKPRGEL